jgi:hypothetical protein
MSRTTLADFQPDNPVGFQRVTSTVIPSYSTELRSTHSSLIIQNPSLAYGAPEGLGYGK